MSTETLEFEDDTIPPHVEHFLRQKARERVVKVLDDDEMRQVEPWQYFGPDVDFTPINTTK